MKNKGLRYSAKQGRRISQSLRARARLYNATHDLAVSDPIMGKSTTVELAILGQAFVEG